MILKECMTIITILRLQLCKSNEFAPVNHELIRKYFA